MCQPDRRSFLLTSRSRVLFRSSFLFQNVRLLAGILPCIGQACQKHPSIKTANRIVGNTKSGFPNVLERRRHPLISNSRKSRIRASSVAALPRLLTRDMISDLLCRENTSVIALYPGYGFPAYAASPPASRIIRRNRTACSDAPSRCPKSDPC